MPEGTQVRRVRYLNNIVDQRFIKERVRSNVRIKVLSLSKVRYFWNRNDAYD